MVHLEEVVNKNDFVLLDLSVLKSSNYSFDHSKNTIKYLKKKSVEIRENIRSIDQLKESFKIPNVYTIPEITKEILMFKKVIRWDMGYLICKFLLRSNLSKKHHKKFIKNYNLLEGLYRSVNDVSKLSENKELRFHDIIYNKFCDFTKYLTQELNLKRDNNYLYGKKSRDSSYDSDTDERLISALYYLSYFGKNSAIITRDRDFNRIIGKVTRVLSSGYFCPKNNNFNKNLLKGKFSFYYGYLDNFNLMVDSLGILKTPGNYISGIARKLPESLKDYIYEGFDMIENVRKKREIITNY